MRKVSNCLFCNKVMNVRPSRQKEGKDKFCSKECYSKWQKNHLQNNIGKTGKDNPYWKGGKYITDRGYVMIYKPNHPFTRNNWHIPEHRLVMEKYLKRYLKPTEIVHHINGNLSDNRIDNLILFSSNSEHMKFHHPLGRQVGK